MFDLRPMTFSDRLDPVDSFQNLPFDANQSNLRQALETLSARFKNRPVAGVLLFTDGNWTDPLESVDWANLGFPVFAVSSLQYDALPDLRIDNIAVGETDFETAPITIDAEVFQQNLNNAKVNVALKKSSGEILEQTLVEFADQPSQPVRFRFRPEKSGVSFYGLECSLIGEESLVPNGVSKQEVTLANNQQLVPINQRSGPYEILYVSGRPNWEFKYLRRALDEDAEVNLRGLVRLARKQPKFSFRDSSIKSSANPLFAGLGGEEEEIAEQLDEPVVISIGDDNSKKLADGFPTEPEALFSYSAIIIDDLEAGFFSQDQLLLLRQFVSLRGGSLLFLGGEDALDKGGYNDSPLADLAPVYLASGNNLNDPGRNESFSDPSGIEYKMELTREGMLEPFMRLRGTEEGESQRVAQAPPLKVLNQAERIKPGAVVLATARSTTGENYPALVSHAFGRGKTVAMMFGDLWRWSLQDGLPGKNVESMSDQRATSKLSSDDPAQVWRQLVRWLVSDVQQKVTMATQLTAIPNVIRLVVDVRSEDFTPYDSAKVEIKVVTPDGAEINLNAEPDAEVPGRFNAEIWSRDAGGYLAQSTALAPDGSQLGTASIGWTSDPGGDEFKQLGINKRLLEEIARQTGGELVPSDRLAQIANSLSSRPVPVTETWTFPLWHRWWILSLAVACLCGEWGIRRWRGMP